LRVGGAAIVFAALAVAGAIAQSGGVAPVGAQPEVPRPWWQTALQHGTLTVWMVSKATNDDKLRIGRDRLTAAIQPSKVYVEKTTSELGQTSNTYGQTSSTYGQTSGSFGTAASNTGQTSSTYGTAPSNVGTSSSNYGQTSSTYGQTAGSFGQTAGSYGTVASESNMLRPEARHVQDAQQDAMVSQLSQTFPSLTVHVEDVTDLELRDRLTAARSTETYPDVVVGVQYTNWWWQSGLGMAMLGERETLDGRPITHGVIYAGGTVDLLRGAPHGDAAKAFWVWVSGASQCMDCAEGRAVSPEVPVVLAKSALRRVLAGAALGGDADPDAAVFGLQEASGMALASFSRGGVSNVDTKLQIETIAGFAAGNVAAVSLRAVVAASDAYGVLNGLVVLRKGVDGRWRVLQISPNLWTAERGETYSDLLVATAGKTEGPLKPVAVASPEDGDVRPEHPDLWWDNAGAARLQMVEWQRALAGTWTASQLMPVVDTDVHLQTRTTASFARDGFRYRWRVWSVGRGGALVMTGWRTFTVAGH
jgi:hypothetical protein